MISVVILCFVTPPSVNFGVISRLVVKVDEDSGLTPFPSIIGASQDVPFDLKVKDIEVFCLCEWRSPNRIGRRDFINDASCCFVGALGSGGGSICRIFGSCIVGISDDAFRMGFCSDGDAPLSRLPRRAFFRWPVPLMLSSLI